MKFKGIKFTLTERQTEFLRPLFDEISEMDAAEDHGSVFAQIHETEDGGVIRAILVPNNICREIQKVIGVCPGRITEKGGELWALDSKR